MASTTTGSRIGEGETAAAGGGGGFMPPNLPSPAPSTPRPSTPSLLPKPRTHPLRAGSAKEAIVINHIDTTLLRISRRHAKKFSSAYYNPNDPSNANTNYSPVSSSNQKVEEEDDVQGYESFKEVARDLEGLVDVLWVSGTPSLQIPYLISLAIQVNSYLPEYPFSAAPTFRLLRKLDEVFAELLGGGEGQKKCVVSMTEKVRIKSIAESCRVLVVETREKENEDGLGEEDDYDEDEDEEFEDVYGNANKLEDYMPIPGKWEMETAKVYERTIQLLGDELGTVGEFCDDDMAAGEGEVCDTGDFVVELDEDES
ncbi:hypothetical protein AbraIFM66951_009754 [Aspergillus brasiliensis]|uniref:Uncharacterized protein n=1 Tax=Aspergillus brasiliensis TaxID=319629 RepID=A0A9W6DQU8_9EURO|nr:hypothetical protein AbraCBS73388_010304 [Aspergillus brasiliensis]GKZ46618.1 hypothetical protein AbraIFM66951_009754 [Aspergillus brasiliensis]